MEVCISYGVKETLNDVSKCTKCNSTLALFNGHSFFEIDQECFKCGQKTPDNLADKEIYLNQRPHILYCLDCDEVKRFWIGNLND